MAASGLQPWQRARVMMHEIGHAYGIGEIGDPRTCNTSKRVMWQNNWKWACGWRGNPPWAWDVRAVNDIY